MRTLVLLCVVLPSFAQSTNSPSPPSSPPKRLDEKQGTEKATGVTGANKGPHRSVTPTATSAAGPNQSTIREAEGPINRKADQVWTRAFAPETWSNWALFVAAITAAGIALRTLRAIQEQARISHIGLNATRLAANAAREGANASKISAEAAAESNTLTRESNQVTAAVADLTKQSVEAARESNAITREATELTRRSLILAQRPKIKIRNVEIPDIGRLLQGEPLNAAGTLQLYNSGGSDAHVSGITCQLFAFDKLPMMAPYPPPGNSDNIALPPGFYGTRSFPFDAVDFPKFVGIRQESIGLYIMGEVAYRDDMGIYRTTRFCRLFDWKQQRFFPIADPDYEHAD